MILEGRRYSRDEANPVICAEGELQTGDAFSLMQHTGWGFTAVNQADVGSGNAINITWYVPTTNIIPPGHVHFTYQVVAEAECEIAFWEDIVRTANTGNAITPVCINRANPTTSAWVGNMFTDATINTSNSTRLDVEVIGNAKQVGGSSKSLFGWTLRRGLWYSVVVSNQSGAANETTLRFQWGRHLDI